MKSSRIRWIVPAVLMMFLITTSFAGGWAAITVEHLPEYLVAGKPETLTFLVRQHGFSLTDGLKATLTASESGGLTVKGTVIPTGKPGQYKAVLSVLQPGNWTVEINPGLFAVAPLLPIKAIRADVPVPAVMSGIARGEQLYVAKGCVACHVNKEVAVRNVVPEGPDLTGRRFPADHLKKFLADPAGTLGKALSEVRMPNLNLSKDEIDALEAFINRDRPALSSGKVH
jgi:cytochrome c551/c552